MINQDETKLKVTITDQDYNGCTTMPAKKKERVAMYIPQGHIHFRKLYTMIKI